MGVIVLRWHKPDLERPYRVPAFPWLPIIFCIASVGIAVSAVAESPARSLAGIGLILLGIPLFLFFRSSEHGNRSPEAVISNLMDGT